MILYESGYLDVILKIPPFLKVVAPHILLRHVAEIAHSQQNIDSAFSETGVVDSRIWVKLLRAHGGCLGVGSRRRA